MVPILALSVGLGPLFSPPKRLLPITPSAACHSQRTAPSSSHSATRAAQISSSTPSATKRWNQPCRVEVGAEAPGQPVPLAAGAHAVDDAVEDEAEVRAGPAGAGTRVMAGEDRLDPLPELVRQLPDRRQGASGGSVGDRQGTLLSRGMCLAVSARGDITPAAPGSFRIVTKIDSARFAGALDGGGDVRHLLAGERLAPSGR